MIQIRSRLGIDRSIMPARIREPNRIALFVLIQRQKTVSQIARDLRLHVSTVSKTLHCERKNKETRSRIARYLHISASRLFGTTQNGNEETKTTEENRIRLKKRR